MANSPKTMRVTNDYLADEIMRAGQRLIELGMLLRAGFDVPVECRKSSGLCPQPCAHLSQEDAREGRECPIDPCTCGETP